MTDEQAPSVHRLPGESGRIRWLDVIRGLAILGVILYHTALPIYGIPPFDHPKDDWPSLGERVAALRPVPGDALLASVLMNAFRYLGWLGYQGTHLFLVLSGFSLTLSSMRRFHRGSTGLGSFLGRRLVRIFPLYWTGHIFFLLTYLLVGRPATIAPLDSRFYLSLLGVRFLPETFFYISPAWWYVGLILQLYLIFPLLWAWLQRTGRRRFWIGSAAITLASRFFLLIVVGTNQEMWSMGALFVTRLAEFTFGMAMADWLVQHPNGLESLRRKRWSQIACLLFYALGLALSFTIAGSVVSHSLIAIGLFGFSYAFSQSKVIASIRLDRTLGWFGRHSYPLMILHQPILWWFIRWARDRLHGLAFSFSVILVLIVIVLGATALNRAVEFASSWVVNRLSGTWLRVIRTRHGEG